MHGLGILLIVALCTPFVVFAVAFFMSKAGDWAWRSERNRRWAMLATGALYLAEGAVYLWNGEPWPMGAFLTAGGVVWAVAGLVGLARASRGAHSPTS